MPHRTGRHSPCFRSNFRSSTSFDVQMATKRAIKIPTLRSVRRFSGRDINNAGLACCCDLVLRFLERLSMTIGRGFLSVAMLTATLLSAHSSWGADTNSWDGTWSGTLGKTKPWPISVSISDGKVVSFTESGVPFDIKYTKMTSDAVFFGDQAHYNIKLIKTGDSTASAKVHGRHGVGTASLTKG